MRLLTAFLAAALIIGAAAPASASDHDRARRAVEEGRILPLKEILARARSAYPGQVIEAELEDEGGMVVYEIKILTTDGRVMKLNYNAATGELLKTRDRNGRR
jgi:uncharacterized membrane protein YkoI